MGQAVEHGDAMRAEPFLGGYALARAGAGDMGAVMALRRARFGVGLDEYDAASTQIMVLHQGVLIATFRLRPLDLARDARAGYTAQFYDLRPLAALPGPALEVGRFCLLPGCDKTQALRLSFAAMAAEVERLGAGLLLGCASFQGADPARHHGAMCQLVPYIHAVHDILSFDAQAIDLKTLNCEIQRRESGQGSLPPLLRSYLSLGGWVGRHMVRDRELDTLHVFTAVQVDTMAPGRVAALRAMAAQLMDGKAWAI